MRMLLLLISLLPTCQGFATMQAVPPGQQIAGSAADDAEGNLDSPGLIIEATAGWDGTVDRNTAVPISLLLSNVTTAVIEGDLVLTDPTRGTEVFVGEIVLAPQSTRRFGVIRDLSSWFQCFVTLRSKSGDGLWRRELSVNTGHSYEVNENFALLVDDSGRRLITKKKGAMTTAVLRGFSGRSPVAGEAGRPVRNLNVKTWQLPDHPGPLLPVHAIIFPEAAPVKEINKKQWQALARWVCQGGTVFVHEDSADVMQQLTDASPLTFAMSDADDPFTVRKMGIGSIREFPQPLFSSEGAKTREAINDQVALLGEPSIRDFLATAVVEQASGQTEAQLNRLYIASFFGIYTLLSGLFALMMFRFSKRKIGIYILTVVGAACVMAAVLGGVLRASRGDLRWVSVTESGAGGLVQVSRIEVQSAGGRTDAVGIKGPDCDLQYTGRIDDSNGYYGYYGWGPDRPALTPFTVQPSLQGPDVADAYNIRVGMTPWGRRRLEGVGFRNEPNRLEFKLKYEKAKAEAGARMPRGRFKVEISNPTSMQFSNAWLVVGVTRRAEENEEETGYQSWDQFGRLITVDDNADGLIDVYQSESITLPAVGAEMEKEFDASFRQTDYYGGQTRTTGGWFEMPRIGRVGTAKAWIVARLVRSPILRIDTQQTEFVAQDEFHVFVQEIQPEDMAAAELFLGPELASPDKGSDDVVPVPPGAP
jgi:hypothetical protein